jgi:hypothetical protein
MSALIRPMAIGVIHHAPDTTPGNRRQSRVMLASHAHRERFTLLETYDLGGSTAHDEVMLSALSELVERHNVRIVLTMGQVDLQRLRRACHQEPLVVLSVLPARSGARIPSLISVPV